MRELGTWDSRELSLGDYRYSELQHRLSIDGETYRRFVPDEPSAARVRSSVGGFSEYITERDWLELKTSPLSPKPVSERVISRAHELIDTGHARFGLIEAMLAFERIVEEAIAAGMKPASPASAQLTAAKALAQLNNTNLPVKALALPSLFPETKIGSADVGAVLKANELRNRIVHERATPHPKKLSVMRELPSDCWVVHGRSRPSAFHAQPLEKMLDAIRPGDTDNNARPAHEGGLAPDTERPDDVARAVDESFGREKMAPK